MLVSHFTSASKPSVLPRLHSSTKASTLSRASLKQSQQQIRTFRLAVKSSYYHRISSSSSRDIDILNRRLMLSRQAGVPISFSRVAGIAGSVVCERKSTVDVDLQKLKHDSNQAAVYLARTTFTSYKPKGYDQPRSSQSYTTERNASRRINKYGPSKNESLGNVECAVAENTFSGYRPQFEEFKPPGAPFSKGSDNILLNKPPPPSPPPAGSVIYVTDSELYLDGRTLEQELSVYYKPVQHNEPDGSPIEVPCPIREALKDYDTKADCNYNGFGYNEPDGKPPVEAQPIEHGLGEYDQKAQYDASKPFTFNEPDGLLIEPSCVVESALGDYDQKAQYEGSKPFTFNEPDGLLIEEPCAVESALNEYDAKLEANDYKPFAHNEPNGQQAQAPRSAKAALNECDQKWEPKIENDNFFFDEDFVTALEKVAATAPTVATKDANLAALKTEAELTGAAPIRKVKTSAGFIKGRKETANEKKARRAKLESDFEKSSDRFVRDIEAVRKSDKIRHSKKQLEQFEIEASVLLNQYHHLRGKIDARLEELEAEDKNAGGLVRREVSTGGAAFSDAIESTATTHPFKSGIDVRREEEVFSGGKGDRRWEKRQRRAGKVRRVLGGAVAGAGVFYAAGVVSEFFTTGGREGTGAVGL